MTLQFQWSILRFVLLGACTGALVGGMDAIDTIADGWGAPLKLDGQLGLVFACVVLTSSAGTLVGLAWGILSTALARLGVHWRPEGLAFKARIILPIRWLPLLVVGLVAIWSTYVWWRFRGLRIIPWGYGVCGSWLALSALGGFAVRFRGPAAATAFWSVLLGWVGVLTMRVIPGASRAGMARLVLAFSVVGFILLCIIALSSRPLATSKRRLPERTPFVTLALLACAGALLVGGRWGLGITSNTFRLVLCERTTLNSLLIRMLPYKTPDFPTLRAALSCPSQTVPQAIPQPQRTRRPARGVLVVFVDTLRGDHFPPSEHSRAVTPELTRFASTATIFSRAYTSAPTTRHAVQSMLTGRAPLPVKRVLKSQELFLGPILKAADIRSIALVDHDYVTLSTHAFGTVEKISRDYRAGLKSGRWSYDSPDAYARAREQLDAVAASDERFFMLVHFYDPHGAYVPNPMFDFGTTLHDFYDGEVALTDHYIGRLLEHLDTTGLADDTAVLVVSDHGDELWEHRYYWHSRTVYEESVHVGMVLSVSDGTPGQVRESPVSVIDVFPTVLDLLGLDIPSDIEGISLASAAYGSPIPQNRPIYMASKQVLGVVQGRRKLILNREHQLIEYYHLDTDPHERWNLGDAPAKDYRDLYCPLINWAQTHHVSSQ
jgi:hypothetical protein